MKNIGQSPKMLKTTEFLVPIERKKTGSSLTPEGHQRKRFIFDHVTAESTKPVRNRSNSPVQAPKAWQLWGNREILPKPSRFDRVKIKPVSCADYVHGAKLLGIWDQYSGIWFNIHSKNIDPLLAEFPLPKKQVAPVTRSATKSERLIINQERPKKVLKKPRSADGDVPMCLKCTKKKRRGVVLGCKHYFCKECLHEHFKKHLEERKSPVKCMVPDCKYIFEKYELIKIAQSSEEVRSFYEMNVANFVEKRPNQLAQCFGYNCGYIVDISKLKDKSILNCPRCKKNYCMSCHQIAHPGSECREEALRLS